MNQLPTKVSKRVDIVPGWCRTQSILITNEHDRQFRDDECVHDRGLQCTLQQCRITHWSPLPE